MEKRATPYTLLAETLWSKRLHPTGRRVEHHGDPLGRARSYGKKSKVLRAKELGLLPSSNGGTRQKVLTLLHEGLDLIALGT